jgi:RecJ-like exonuclease
MTLQGSEYQDFNQAEEVYPQETGSTAEDFIGDDDKEPGVWDKDAMADITRDKIDNGELTVCKKCGLSSHNPKYSQCYDCSGMRQRQVTMVKGCPNHLNDPSPALCSGCREVKRQFFAKTPAHFKGQ